MDSVRFFEGRITGAGVIRDLFGRIVRRVRVEFVGRWAEEHDPLHLDETYTYSTGETQTRSWALESHGQRFIGYDAAESARIRGEQVGQDLHFVFDRPFRPGSWLAPPPVEARLLHIGPGRLILCAEARFAGIRLATTDAVLRRA